MWYISLGHPYRYWGNPEQTNAVMKWDEKDPDTLWMHTGDQVTIDKEGYMRSESYSIFTWHIAAPGIHLATLRDFVVSCGANQGRLLCVPTSSECHSRAAIGLNHSWRRGKRCLVFSAEL